jgi:hypothetical protein
VVIAFELVIGKSDIDLPPLLLRFRERFFRGEGIAAKAAGILITTSDSRERGKTAGRLSASERERSFACGVRKAADRSALAEAGRNPLS